MNIDNFYYPTQLGCSPAEEAGTPEVRDMSWHDHDATAELRLWEDDK